VLVLASPWNQCNAVELDKKSRKPRNKSRKVQTKKRDNTADFSFFASLTQKSRLTFQMHHCWSNVKV